MITKRQLAGIRKQIDRLDRGAREAAIRVIERVGADDVELMRDALSEALRPICENAFSMSSDLAASVYNAWRVADIGEALEAVPKVSTFDAGKFEAMLNTAMQPGANIESIVEGYIGYNTRASYTDTLMSAGHSDPKRPRYARVPEGAETCDFCMMLASRGFEYRKGKDGESVHNHANCQCVYVASWEGNPRAEGYEPREWYERWNDEVDARAERLAEANGTTAAEERAKINRNYAEASKRAKERAKHGS